MIEPTAAGAERRFRFSLKGLFKAVLVCGVLFALVFRVILPLVAASREAADRAVCINNLKGIGIALHGYHDVFHRFPPAQTLGPNGKPWHSWRMLILPYLTQLPLQLENGSPPPRYDYKQPWNSPNNMAIGNYDIHYSCPQARPKRPNGCTNYVMIVGPDTASPDPDTYSLNDFGGAANETVIVAEIADSDIYWSEPRDLKIDEMSFQISDRGKPCIGSHHLHGAMVLMADGGVQFLDESTPPEKLKELLTRPGARAASLSAVPQTERKLQ